VSCELDSSTATDPTVGQSCPSAAGSDFRGSAAAGRRVGRAVPRRVSADDRGPLERQSARRAWPETPRPGGNPCGPLSAAPDDVPEGPPHRVRRMAGAGCLALRALLRRPVGQPLRPGMVERPGSRARPAGGRVAPRALTLRPLSRGRLNLAQRRRPTDPGRRVGRTQCGRTAAWLREVHHRSGRSGSTARFSRIGTPIDAYVTVYGWREPWSCHLPLDSVRLRVARRLEHLLIDPVSVS
jgi:hypothetical protein